MLACRRMYVHMMLMQSIYRVHGGDAYFYLDYRHIQASPIGCGALHLGYHQHSQPNS